MTTEAYSQSFYAEQSGGSVTSAEAVVPFLIETFHPQSVVDVGCGVGGWLASFRSKGIVETVGIDGAWVATEDLLIPADSFVAADLTGPIDVGRIFDLCLSLEVAEHLDEQYADGFVATLVGLAPVVIFSAAIPGQTGVHHVNEQWQSYWAERFRRHDFVPVDCVRPMFWTDRRVSWWYAQNTVAYVLREHLPTRADLCELADRRAPTTLDLVHPALFESVSRALVGASAPRTARGLLDAAARRVRSRLPTRT